MPVVGEKSENKFEIVRITPVFSAGLEVAQELFDEGFTAYVVGGAVRDLILGGNPTDIDVATNAPAEIITDLFPGAKRIFPFDYQVFQLRGDGWTVEIARMREDVETFGRQARVRFTDDMDKDLARRDFTVNAMAVLPDRTFVDKFGGYSDLKKRLIRTIGDPEIRFRQDYLRMVRAVRFAAQLGFTIELATEKALESLVHLCAQLSPSWLWREFRKGVRAPKNFVELLQKYRLGEVLFGEFVDFAAVDAAGVGCVHRRNDDPEVFWAFFFYDRGKNFRERMEKISRRIEFPKSLRKGILHTADMIDQLRNFENLPPRQLAKFLTDPKIVDFLSSADCFTDLAPAVSKIRIQFPGVGKITPPDGNLLRARGLSGRQLGEKLAQITLDLLRGRTPEI